MEQFRPPSRSAIQEAALEVLGANPGASLAEIAARAGVGRATLHRHFASRAELLRALAIEALDTTDAAVAGMERAPSARAATERMFEALVPLATRFHFLSRCPVDDPEVERRYAAQVDGLRDLAVALRTEGHVAPGVPDAWVVALCDTLVWTAWSAVAGGEVAANDAVRLATRSLFEGIGDTR